MSAIRCEEFEIRLQSRFDEIDGASELASSGDGTVPGVEGAWERDPVLASHAGQCSACALLASDLASVVRATAHLPMPRPSSDLVERVLAALRHDRNVGDRESPIDQRSWAAWAAMAAGLMIAALCLLSGRPVGPASSPANDSALVVAMVPDGPQAASANSSSPDASAVTAVEYTTGFSDVVLLLPDPMGLAMGGLGAASPDSWVGSLNDGFRPISKSADSAWDGLFQALPQVADSRQY